MVLHICNPSVWEIKARESGVHGHAKLHETLSQKKNWQKKKFLIDEPAHGELSPVVRLRTALVE